MFTDALYDTIDFEQIDSELRALFPHVVTSGKGPVGMGRFYSVGYSEYELVKLDLIYTEPYIQNIMEVDGIRLATIEEVIAMKVNVIQRGGRKKDFWDIHELLTHYTLEKMVALHELRYPYDHDATTIREKFIDFSKADDEVDPICLKGKYWEIIKLDIASFASS